MHPERSLSGECGSTLKVLALERVEKFETNRLKMKLTSSWRDETLVMSLRICETKDENPAVIGDKVRMRTKNELLEVVVVVVEQGLDLCQCLVCLVGNIVRTS